MLRTIDVPAEIRKDDIQEDGVFKGIASTFGGQPDSHGDVIKAGAFSDSLREGGRNGSGIAMLYSHKTDEPIGTWIDLKETKRGLEVIGKLTLGVRRADEAHLLMKDGAMKGLSIGFNIDSKDDIEYDEKRDIRLLKKINLWEISPVVFPSNTRAKITNVKEAEIGKLLSEADNIRDVEGILREAGFSNSVSKLICSWWRSSRRREQEEKTALLNVFKDVNKIIGG